MNRWYLSSLVAIVGLSLAFAGEDVFESGWTTRIGEEIRQAEYRFSPSEDGAWTAPNRIHGLRARIDRHGAQVAPRDLAITANTWSLELDLVRYGRGEALAAVDPAWPEAEGNRIEIYRGEGLTEWYVNDDRGLEQGFTLEWAPGDRRSDLPVVLEMALVADLEAHSLRGGRSILFRQEGRPVLRYAGLTVRDTGGREVPARLVLLPGLLRIVVEDGEAVYPLEVDPLLTTPSWIGEADQSNAWFGISVDGVGDVNNDDFDDIIVGAYRYDNGESDEGRAFLYHGSATGPSVTPAWTAEGNQSSAYFGFSVAGAGDVNNDGFDDVIVGAYRYDGGDDNEGRAFLYLGSSSGLGATADWTAEIDQATAYFGFSVSGAGDVNNDGFDDVLVGARAYDNGQNNEGGAFLYLGSATVPSATADWSTEGNDAFDELGYAVSGAGDVNDDGFDDILVGARAYADGESNEGRALLFLGSAGGPSATADWTAESDNANAEFGTALAGAGDVNNDGYDDIIVGAHNYTDTVLREGGAFVYHGSAAGPENTPAWSAFGGQERAELGISVDSVGDANVDGFADIIVGTRGFDIGPGDSTANVGRADIFTGSDTGLDATSAWTVTGDQAGGEFGHAVASAGDVDGDSATDAIVGARGYDPHTTRPNAGQAYVFLAFQPSLEFSLRSPPDGVEFYPDDPPETFRWFPGDYQEFKVEWSRNDRMGDPRKTSGQTWATGEEYVTDPARWLQILKLGVPRGRRTAPGASGPYASTIYWRVRARGGAGAQTLSEIRTFTLATPKPAGIISPEADAIFTTDSPAPLITWDPNHNVSYRVIFSANNWMSRPRVTSGKGYTLTGTSWQVPDDVWAKVLEKLWPRSEDGFIRYVILAKDPVNRKTPALPRTFLVIPPP